MPITLTAGSTTETLPPQLLWTDEFDWQKVVDTTDYSVTGVLLIDRGVKAAGRPITLRGGPDRAWMGRTQLLTLRGWADSGSATAMTLNINGTAYTVHWDHSSGSPISAQPVFPDAIPDSGTRYVVVLKFITT